MTGVERAGVDPTFPANVRALARTVSRGCYQQPHKAQVVEASQGSYPERPPAR